MPRQSVWHFRNMVRRFFSAISGRVIFFSSERHFSPLLGGGRFAQKLRKKEIVVPGGDRDTTHWGPSLGEMQLQVVVKRLFVTRNHLVPERWSSHRYLLSGCGAIVRCRVELSRQGCKEKCDGWDDEDGGCDLHVRVGHQEVRMISKINRDNASVPAPLYGHKSQRPVRRKAHAPRFPGRRADPGCGSLF